ncbi:DNA-processing protein DprA [Rossellomorea sp. KS-H15a]|uniref:DNA-processing protein DprA n=1 Tax=Rossellomorea sp. KS-H15a TaxID=2963940 RepID=UPI0020C5B842|nr:DNA-processing protein DprA [Rossellomorea sp. KS-H15a]UTE75380.1 DNA-processing protein DprA [Rossellomorea sp. KS-H15a]
MEGNRHLVFHIHHCRGIGLKGIKRLVQTHQDLYSVLRLPKSKLQQITHATTTNLETFYKDLHSFPSKRYMKLYAENHIEWITVFDEDYPALLKNVYDPPFLLFLKGDRKLLHASPKLAVIGSRNATSYTEKVLHTMIPQLVKREVVIVSGLAKGADTIAHKEAIRSGGRTIGVLGGGFQHIYPKQNVDLANHMMDHHLLLSEYPPYIKPERWHFPFRNRIISGLSDAVLVTEATKKSGTFITADYALNEGREVLCLPGSIHDPLAEGTNTLIQEGAKMVLSIEDIFSELSV